MRLHFLNCLVLVIVMIIAQTLGEIFPKRSINEPNFPESVDAFFDNGSEEDLEDNFSNLRYLPSLEKPDLDKRSTEFNSMKLLKRSKLRKNNILNFESDKLKSRRLLRKNKRNLTDGNNNKIVNYLKELEHLLSKKRNAHKNSKIRKKKDSIHLPISNECGKPTEFKIKKQRKPLLTNLPYDAPMMTLNRPYPTECHTHKPTKATPPTTIPPTTTPIPRWPKTSTTKTTPCPPETPTTTTEHSTKFTTVHSTASLEETTYNLVTKMESTTEPYNNIIWPESLDKTVVESERQIRELERQKAALKRRFHQQKRFTDERLLEKKGKELKKTIDDINILQNKLEMQDMRSKKVETRVKSALLENMYGKATTKILHEVFHYNYFEPTESHHTNKPISTERYQPVQPYSKPVAQSAKPVVHRQNVDKMLVDVFEVTTPTVLHLSSTDSSNDDIEFLQELDSPDLIDTDIFQALHNLDTHLSTETTTASNTYSKKKHRGKRKATFSDLPMHNFAVSPIDISSNENFNYKTDSLNGNFLKFPVKKLFKKSANKAKDTFYMRPDNKLNKIYEFRKKNAVHHKRKIPENVLFHEEPKNDEDQTTLIFEEDEDLESSESAKVANGGINTEILTEATEVNNESITLSLIYVNLPTNPPNVSSDDGSIENYYLQQLYPASKEVHTVFSTVPSTEEPESLSPEYDEPDTTAKQAITTENCDNVNQATENVKRAITQLQMAKHSDKNMTHKLVSASASAAQSHSPVHQNENENNSDEKDSIENHSKHERETEEQTKTELTEHETDEQESEQKTEESKEEHEGEENEYNSKYETEEQEHETEECDQESVTEEAKSLLEEIKQKLAETNQSESIKDAEHVLEELKEMLETYALHHNLTTIEDQVETTEETVHETKESLEPELNMEENTKEHVTEDVECKTDENAEHETDEHEEQETEENEHETELCTTEYLAEEYTEHVTEDTTLMENSDNIVEHDTEIQTQVENQIIAAEETSNEINQDHEFEVPQSEYDNSKDSEEKEPDDSDEDESNHQTEETESQVLANPELNSKDDEEQKSEATSESQREPNPPRIEHQSKVNMGITAYHEPKKYKQYVGEKVAHETKLLNAKYNPQEEKEYEHMQLIEDTEHQTTEYLHEDRNDESKEIKDKELEFFKSIHEDETTENSDWIIKKTKHKNKHTTTEEAEWLIKEIKQQINEFEHMKHEHHDESKHKTEETEDEINELETEENTEEHVQQTEQHIQPETETHTKHETEEHVHETTEEAKILLKEKKDKLAETDAQKSDENMHHILEEFKDKLEEYDHHLTTVEVAHETTDETKTLLKEIKGKLAETDAQKSDENMHHILEKFKNKLEEYDHHLTTVEVAHETTDEAMTLLKEIKGKLEETDRQESDENAHHILEEIKEKLEEYDHHLTTVEVGNVVTTEETKHETEEHAHETEGTEKNAEQYEHETTEDVDQLIKEALETIVEYQHHLHLTEHGETVYEHETEEYTEKHNHETAEDKEGIDKSELYNNNSITTEPETKKAEDEYLSKQIERVYGINVTEELTHETDKTTHENNEQNVPTTTVEADLILKHIESELEEYIAHKNKRQRSNETQDKEAEENTFEEHRTESVTTEETHPSTFTEKSTTEKQVLHTETVASTYEIPELTIEPKVTHEDSVATTKENTKSTTEQAIQKETIVTTEKIAESTTEEIAKPTTKVTTKEATIPTNIEQQITSSEENTKPIETITDEVPEFTINTSESTTVEKKNEERTTVVSQTSEDLYNELSITNRAIKLSNFCTLEDYEAKDHCICSIKYVLQDLFDDINKINSSENYDFTCKNFIHIEPGIIISNKSESKILRKRKTGDFIETYVWKREARVGRDIDDFLSEDLIIPNGNVTYVNVGSKVVIPCIDDMNPNEPKENINYHWTIENGSPETTGDRPNNGSSLVISSVSPQDSDNYTCTIEDRNNHQVTFSVHQLSVVSLPGYNLVVTVHLNASSTCEPGDMEVLNLYYPVAIKDLLCSGKAERVCNIVVEKPQCIRLGSEDIISLHATLSTKPLLDIFPTLDTKTCNLSCQSRVYSIIVSILLKNLVSVTNLPVACPAYTFNPGNQMTCTPCPRGTYQPAVGSRMCLPCNSPLDDSSCFLPGAIANISRKYYIIPIVTLVAIFLVIGCCCCLQKKEHVEKTEAVEKDLSEKSVKKKSSKNLIKPKSSSKTEDESKLNAVKSKSVEDKRKSNTRTKETTKSKNELHKNKSSKLNSKLRQKYSFPDDSEEIEIVVTNPNPRNKIPPKPPSIDF